MDETAPDISVVVATRDRAGRLSTLLDALSRQTLDRARFEVVIVDDGSVDQTPALLASAPHGTRSLRRDVSGGPALARDAGWRAARGALIAFTDDDCVPDPAWLEAAVAAAARHPGAIIQGRIDALPADEPLQGPFARAVRVAEATPTFPTGNVVYPRDVLERVGGFDTEHFGFGGEDTDLAWRAIGAGADTAFAPEMRVFHPIVGLGPIGKLRLAARWSSTMQTFARHPELRRRQLTYRVFWKGSHYLLVRALVAWVLPRRWHGLRRWLAWPYVLHLLERGRLEGGGPALAPYYFLHDMVELFAVVRGAVRYRTPVL